MSAPTVSFHHVDINRDGNEEPVMAINRVTAGRHRNRIFIPLGLAHIFVSSFDNVDGGEITRRAIKYCDHLYGIGLYTAGEVKRVCDLILDNLDYLLKMPPKREMTRREFENKIDHAGLVLKVNGETVVDAS